MPFLHHGSCGQREAWHACRAARGVLCSALVGRDAKKQRYEKQPPPGTSLCAREAVPPRLQIIRANSFAASHSLLTQKKRWENKMSGTTAGVHRWGRGETGRDLACFLGQLLRGFLSAQIFTPLALPRPVQQSRGQDGEGFFSFGCGE